MDRAADSARRHIAFSKSLDADRGYCRALTAPSLISMDIPGLKSGRPSAASLIFSDIAALKLCGSMLQRIIANCKLAAMAIDGQGDNRSV